MDARKTPAAGKALVRDMLFIFLGSTVTAFAAQYLFDPAGLVTGGVSGLAIVVKYLGASLGGLNIPLWVSNLVLNVPIFLFAWKTDGSRAIARSALGWLIMTVELAVFPAMDIVPDDLLLTALYGGICFGLGTGLLLAARASTGGTDLLATALHHFLPHYSMGTIMWVLDGAIVLVGAAVFGVERTLYALISVYLMGKLSDWVLAWGRSARCVTVISEANDAIARDILAVIDRGVTCLHGTGMYTGQEREVLFCICSNKDLVRIKEIIRRYDPQAFFFISDVKEALGEGFVERWH